MNGPVVLAYDRSPAADEAIRVAASLFATRVAIVVTAWEPMPLFTGPIGDPVFPGPGIDAETEAAIESTNAAYASATAEHGGRIARDSGFVKVSVRAASESGRGWETVLAVAAEVGASVIVVGAKGRTSVKAALLGSVSHALAQHADRPVLIVPSSRRDSAATEPGGRQ